MWRQCPGSLHGVGLVMDPVVLAFRGPDGVGQGFPGSGAAIMCWALAEEVLAVIRPAARDEATDLAEAVV